jgi:hypothetical protein
VNILCELPTLEKSTSCGKHDLQAKQIQINQRAQAKSSSFFPSNRPLLLPFFFQFSFIFSRSREFAISPCLNTLKLKKAGTINMLPPEGSNALG